MWTTKSAGAHKMVLTAAVMLTVAGSAYAQRPDDGVRLITQQLADRGKVTTDDAPGFPVTISEAGSFRLGSNLIVPDADTTAIDITAPNVVVDLNGFTILGPGTPGSGVGIYALFQGVTGNVTRVLNGVVDGMGDAGIRLFAGCRVEGVQARRNQIGVAVFLGCTVVNNIVNVNRSIGISAGDGSTVIGNTVRSNLGVGMALAGNVGYVHNVATNNNGGNLNPQVTGGIQMGGNICGSALCP